MRPMTSAIDRVGGRFRLHSTAIGIRTEADIGWPENDSQRSARVWAALGLAWTVGGIALAALVAWATQ